MVVGGVGDGLPGALVDAVHLDVPELLDQGNLLGVAGQEVSLHLRAQVPAVLVRLCQLDSQKDACGQGEDQQGQKDAFSQMSTGHKKLLSLIRTIWHGGGE